MSEKLKVTVLKISPFAVDEWSGCQIHVELDREVPPNPDRATMSEIVSQALASSQFAEYKTRATGRSVEVYEDGRCEGDMVMKPMFIPRRFQDFDTWSFSGRKGLMSGCRR